MGRQQYNKLCGWCQTEFHPAMREGTYCSRACYFSAKKAGTHELNSNTYHKMKICNHCQFPFEPKDPREFWCEWCVPNKTADSRLRRYGVSWLDWMEMVEAQGGHCRLCDRPAEVVDHDHKTNRVRGALCYGCNTLVTGIENEQWFNKAIEYINYV